MQFCRKKMIGTEEEKAGLLYKMVARSCLNEWYPEKSKHLIEELLVRGDIDEIESYVGIKESLKVALTVLKSILKKDKIRLAKDAFEVLLYSETPESDLEETIVEIRLREYSLVEKTVINNALLSAVHDNWVSFNSDRFFDESRVDKLFLFMPYELIGLREVLKDYIFIKDLLILFELNVVDEDLRKGFYRARELFLEKNQLSSRGDLIDFVMKADYNPFERDIVELLRTDRKVAETIAGQIINNM